MKQFGTDFGENLSHRQITALLTSSDQDSASRPYGFLLIYNLAVAAPWSEYGSTWTTK